MTSVTMLQAHEERIRGLEGGQAEIAIDVARLTADVEHLHAAVNEQVVPPLLDISREVSKLVRTIEDGQRDFTTSMSAVNKRLTDLEVAKKQEQEQRVATRALWLGRVTKPMILVLGAAAGALASKVGEAVWAWLHG